MAGEVALATGRRGLTYFSGEGAGGLEFTRATLGRRRWSGNQSPSGAGGGASMRCGLDCVSLGQLLGREWGGRGAAGSGRCWAVVARVASGPPAPRNSTESGRADWVFGTSASPEAHSPPEGPRPAPQD